MQRQDIFIGNQLSIHINTGSDVKVGMFVHFPFRWKTVLCAGPIWCSENALGTLAEIERLRNHRMTTNVRKSLCRQWSLRCCCVHKLSSTSCSRSGVFNVNMLSTAVCLLPGIHLAIVARTGQNKPVEALQWFILFFQKGFSYFYIRCFFVLFYLHLINCQPVEFNWSHTGSDVPGSTRSTSGI